MCCFKQPTEKYRWIHQLHPGRPLHGPTSHEQKGSQATRIQLIDFRNIEHEYADAFQLLDLAPELVQRCPADHAPRTVHDRHILQGFDMILEFHMSSHTHLLWKKFRDLFWLIGLAKTGKVISRKTIERITFMNVTGRLIIPIPEKALFPATFGFPLQCLPIRPL